LPLWLDLIKKGRNWDSLPSPCDTIPYVIERKILDLIKRDRQKGEFIYPDYGRYSLLEVGNTIPSLFGEESIRPTLPDKFINGGERGFSKVVTFFIDALGFDQIVKYSRDYKFLNLLTDRAVIYPLTSVFPSTTSNALTTFYSGQSPLEHGLIEWNLYFNEFGEVIETLPFKLIDSEERDSLTQLGGNGGMLFEGTTIFERLAHRGVKPFHFSNEIFSHSVYSKAAKKGSVTVPYSKNSDLFPQLRRLLVGTSGPAYFDVYWSELDGTGHRFGNNTDEYMVELSTLSHLLTSEFIDKIDRKTAEETLLIIISDHGQVTVNPEEIIWLNKYPELINNFQIGANGKSILPGGSSRDVFLNIRDEKIDESIKMLKDLLRGKAEILTMDDALEAGLFGPGRISQKFIERAGNVLILPARNEQVWYEHVPSSHVKLGMHGGLSEQEMFIPFAAVQLSKLKD